ncbi:C-type lectin domain-containing protein [Kordiimonas aestuarii]|uniref:C-type lectin domain-containing protein n=1 Tax=Kordiimonas aestuarii TaxID=1005925 RepID=UPI0021D02C75|nr:C-type lectin domain-containing protein [Kordiimonas aestuarii]
MSVLASMMVAVTMMMQGVDDTGTAIARPIGDVYLNEETGSYYQVFDFVGKPPHTWEHARRMVKGYRYEGREGRLAVVRDISTHYFLIMKFPKLRQQKMWIGLRATCNETADLEWVDGTSLMDQSFRGFGDGVLRDISRVCRARKDSGDILPVYYEPDQFGVRWQVGSARTDMAYMMVEFPVPGDDDEQPLDEAAAKQ